MGDEECISTSLVSAGARARNAYSRSALIVKQWMTGCTYISKLAPYVYMNEHTAAVLSSTHDLEQHREPSRTLTYVVPLVFAAIECCAARLPVKGWAVVVRSGAFAHYRTATLYRPVMWMGVA